MPRKIVQMSKINKILISLLVVTIIAVSAASYMNYKPVTKNIYLILIIDSAFFIVSLGILNIYKYVLSNKVKKAVHL